MAGSHPSGSSRKRVLGSTCRGKAFRAAESCPRDEGAAETVLVLRSGPARPARSVDRHGTSEIDRRPCSWPKTPREGGAAKERWRSVPRPHEVWETRAIGSKLSARRHARAHPGSDRLNHGPAPRGTTRLRSGKFPRSVGPSSEGCTLGNRTVVWVRVSLVGCRDRRGASSSCRREDAERQIETARGSTARRLPWTRGRSNASGERVRGFGRERQRERHGPRPAARPGN